MASFFEHVRTLVTEQNSMLCVGLDTDNAKLPAHLMDQVGGIIDFNKAIIDATHDLVCCYKPQIAYYSGQGAEEALIETIQYAQG
ncbi:MAG: orotidine 5'-phosphate decarboxylase, partial [Gammaproteobacteria bacterium]|nr:orotidine 5'-phosphate decarboxylase [Gammaproteobacteria bacterium]